MTKAHESMDDIEFLNHVTEVGISGIVKEREERGKRLARRYKDIPKDLSYEEFIEYPDISDLGLDFITSCEMYEEYKK
jgi:hypothetical protein